MLFSIGNLQTVTYPYKVWLFTISLSPMLLFIRLWSFLSDNNSEISQALALLGLAILYGAALSLPSLFLFIFLHKHLLQISLKEWKQKLVFSSVGVFLIWVTFILIDRKFIIDSEFNNIIWPSAYSLCLIGGAFLFKPNHTNIEVSS